MTLPALGILTELQCGPGQWVCQDHVNDALCYVSVLHRIRGSVRDINRKDGFNICQVCQITRLTSRSHHDLDGNHVVWLWISELQAAT